MTSLPGGRRLTEFSPGGGCACKLPQQFLDDVLDRVRLEVGTPTDPALRVGLDPADDAAVYAVDDTRAWVITCDFLTPVVDDPYDWGRIAAANALSDVYAMGGSPLLTLNLLAWPEELAASDALTEVLRGGAATARAAGALVVGGHSIVDPVPKYGMVAVGEVSLNALVTKGGGRPGDVLVLTKPLGVGVIASAVKRGSVSQDAAAAAVATMTLLNAEAAAVARRGGLCAGTDVSGYGLVGHLHELCAASGLAAVVSPERVPVLAAARDLVEHGHVADGGRRTCESALAAGWFQPRAAHANDQALLCDPQTSGGLLLAVPAARVDQVLVELRRRSHPVAAAVGRLVSGPAGHVALQPGA